MNQSSADKFKSVAIYLFLFADRLAKPLYLCLAMLYRKRPLKQQLACRTSLAVAQEWQETGLQDLAVALKTMRTVVPRTAAMPKMTTEMYMQQQSSRPCLPRG